MVNEWRVFENRNAKEIKFTGFVFSGRLLCRVNNNLVFQVCVYHWNSFFFLNKYLMCCYASLLDALFHDSNGKYLCTNWATLLIFFLNLEDFNYKGRSFNVLSVSSSPHILWSTNTWWVYWYFLPIDKQTVGKEKVNEIYYLKHDVLVSSVP